MHAVFNFLVFIFGAVWGSFFYTLSVRFANGEFARSGAHALLGRSRCPHCSTPVDPLRLLPLAGYLIARGRCASCRKRISIGYPLAELVYGLFALLCAARLGTGVESLALFLLLSTAISLSTVDIMAFTIPNPLLVVFGLLAIYPVVLHGSIRDSIYGFLLMFVFFLVVMFIFPGSFGGGDLKFASLIGLASGIESAILVLEVALVSGALIGLVYALKKGKGLRIRIPFAPFLTAGLAVSVLWGRDILLVYYRLFL